MYYVIGASVSSLHRESTDSLIINYYDLKSTTIYAVCVTVTNVIGSTVSQPIFISTSYVTKLQSCSIIG